MSEDSSIHSNHETPHIRINSGRHDPFSDAEDRYSSVPSHQIGRALTPGVALSPSAGTLHTVYESSNLQDSSEFLLPPRPHRFKEEYEPYRSPAPSILSSRRNSWSSETGSYETRIHPYNPFEDPRAPSQADSDEIDVNTQTVAEKYNIMPTDGLLLFPEDVEKDDHLHNPDPSDREGQCDLWNRRGIINVAGLILLTLGFLILFIGYPMMYVLLRGAAIVECIC